MKRTPLIRRKPLRSGSSLKRKSGLRPMSRKRAGANRVYSRKGKAFLGKHPFCQLTIQQRGFNEQIVIENCGDMSVPDIDFFFCVPRSTEIHHMKKPRCKYLNDESTLDGCITRGPRLYRKPQVRSAGQGLAPVSTPERMKPTTLIKRWRSRAKSVEKMKLPNPTENGRRYCRGLADGLRIAAYQLEAAQK